MNIIEQIRYRIAAIKDNNRRAEYESWHESAVINAILIAMKGLPVAETTPPHPLFKKLVMEYKETIKTFPSVKISKGKSAQINRKKSLPVIAFGDSILDIPRHSYTSIGETVNFSISGSWATHMADMAEALKPSLKDYQIHNVVVGTLGGNPLLSQQPIKNVIKESIVSLERIRKAYPDSRLIVFGLPPVYAPNVIEHGLTYDMAIFSWLYHNVPIGNFSYIYLRKALSGFMGIFPNTSLSNDGVHLSNRGVVKLDSMLNQAIESSEIFIS